MAERVPRRTARPSCSQRIKARMIRPSNHFLLLAQFGQQFVEAADAYGFAPRGNGFETEQFHPRLNGHTEVCWSDSLDGFFARLHNARHRGIARLVEAQV